MYIIDVYEEDNISYPLNFCLTYRRVLLCK
nr:MAG TPA: hypothetical protein [Caudoviricetes sp.]